MKNDRIDLIYSAIHDRCGMELRRSDWRIVTQEDLNALQRDTTSNGRLNMIELYCHRCVETFMPTHLQIVVGSEVRVGTTKVEDFAQP